MAKSKRTLTGSEPIDLATVKLALGITHTDHDALINTLISAAREMVEQGASVTLVASTYIHTFEPGKTLLRLPYNSGATITKVAVVDLDETDLETLVAGDTYWYKSADKSYIELSCSYDYRVDVTCTAVANTSTINLAKVAIIKLVSDWYYNLGSVGTLSEDAQKLINNISENPLFS